MSRFYSFSKLKIRVAIFALALFGGLWSGGLFERYVFKFYVSPSFSLGEVENLTGKTVRNVCPPRGKSEEKGVISGYSVQDFGDVYVQIDWSESYDVGMPKSYFKRCVKVVDLE